MTASLLLFGLHIDKLEAMMEEAAATVGKMLVAIV